MRVSTGFFAALAMGTLGLGPALGQGLSPSGAPAAVPVQTSPYATPTFQSYGAMTTGSIAQASPSQATPSQAAPSQAAPSQAAPAAMAEPMTLPPTAAGSGPAPISYVSTEVDGPYIALTFDDGPSPDTTPKLLKMLADHHAKATFFVVGTNANAYPDILKRAVAEGHEIANHSWNHPQLPKLSVEKADQQIADTSAAIQRAIGVTPKYIRPPYGAMTPSLQRHMHDKFGATFIYWSVDPLDWKYRDSQRVADSILKNVRPGAIVLAHDIHPTTVAAMPKVLDTLAARGYKFVTVSELIAMNKPGAKVASLARDPKKKAAKSTKPKQGQQTAQAKSQKQAQAKPSSSASRPPKPAAPSRPAAAPGLF